MSGKCTVRVTLRLEPWAAEYLDQLAASGGYVSRAAVVRSIIEALMRDDVDYRENESAGKCAPAGAGGLTIDMGATKPPWGD